MRHHLTLELTDSASSLIRVVSCLHSRGLRVEHLHVEGTTGCLFVNGDVRLHRVVTTLDRLVDVLAVRPSTCTMTGPMPAEPWPESQRSESRTHVDGHTSVPAVLGQRRPDLPLAIISRAAPPENP